MKARCALLILGLLPVLAGLRVQPARAQDTLPTDDEVNAIAKQLYCPVCENIPLDVCPTQACEQWRGTIRQMLVQGYTEAEIKQYFVAQYGDRVLATPPASGLNWLVYVIPPLAFLTGVWILVRALRSWKRSSPGQGSAPPVTMDDPYVARLEEELRRRA
jgi:cytochrome c-type biogenesis protein CcmH